MSGDIFQDVASSPFFATIFGQGTLAGGAGNTNTGPQPFPTPPQQNFATASPGGLGIPGVDTSTPPPTPPPSAMLPPASAMGPPSDANLALQSGGMPLPGAPPPGGGFPMPPGAMAAAPPGTPAAPPSGVPLPPLGLTAGAGAAGAGFPMGGPPAPIPPGTGAVPPGATPPGLGALGTGPGPNNPAVPKLVASLASALGVNTPNGMQSLMAGIGKGLSTVGVGSLGQGGGLGAFARGAGGAMTGTIGEREKQQKDELAKAANITHQDLVNAQIGDLKSRAEARQGGGLYSPRSTQLLLTDPGKVQAADRSANAAANLERQKYQKELDDPTVDPKRKKEIRDTIDEAGNKRRNEMLKLYGFDPDKAQKIRQLGTDNEHPFEAHKMNMQQFHQDVPVSTVDATGKRIGGWYTDGTKWKDGETDTNGTAHKEGELKLYQRIVPPPGPGQQATLLPEDIHGQGTVAA
jgi:hypothetical protein